MRYQVIWKGRAFNKEKKEWGTVKHVHDTYDTKEEAFKSILNWWEVHKYKPRYIREWKEGKVTIIDYGLHYSFYYIKEVT